MAVMKSDYTSEKTGKLVWRYDFTYQKIRYRKKGFATKSEALKEEESKRREVIHESKCASAVQILSDTCSIPSKDIIKQLTGRAWDEEEGWNILQLIKDGNK